MGFNSAFKGLMLMTFQRHVTQIPWQNEDQGIHIHWWTGR